MSVSKERIEEIRRILCEPGLITPQLLVNVGRELLSYIDHPQPPDAGIEVVGWMGAQINIYGKSRVRLFTDEDIAREWSHFPPIPLCRVDDANKVIAAKDERIAELEALRDKLILEAQGHAQEARVQRGTVNECLQIASGASGEKGDWNGSKPVADTITALRTEIEALKRVAGEDTERFAVIKDAMGDSDCYCKDPGDCCTNCVINNVIKERDAALASAIKKEGDIQAIRKGGDGD